MLCPEQSAHIRKTSRYMSCVIALMEKHTLG